MTIIFREARDSDRKEISEVIAEGFEDEFEGLKAEKVAKAFESGINTNCFFVAEAEGVILGIAGCCDNIKRSVMLNKKDCRKFLGFIKGSFCFYSCSKEFMRPLLVEDNTGFIEFVATRKSARRKKIAATLLIKITTSNRYKDYIIDVHDTNSGAIACYQNVGFSEYKRISVKKSRKNSFKAKIYMRYQKK